jgi:DNA helicase-2/ATP-dependent DNA helicase PcrA
MTMTNSAQQLKTLNEKQLEAVTGSLDPLLVLAGPGTGKTRTLIHRIAYFIKEKNIAPDQVLAITFTNKAVSELRHRLQVLLPGVAENIQAHTFHSFCLGILRENHNFFNLSRFFNIADEYYQAEIIRNFLQQPDEEPKKIKGILRGIANHKTKQVPLRNSFMQDAHHYYKNALLKNNSIDFDDIILMTNTLFTLKPDVLAEWQGKIAAVLVDEFQDTDINQYKIIRNLAAIHRNITVVADDDQSIFSWRGANPENIKMYIQDFRIPAGGIVQLTQNYRSSKAIYTMASRPLQQTDRLFPDKEMRLMGQEGLPVQYHRFQTIEEEAGFIAKTIKDWHLADFDRRYSDMAIIYPRHIIGEAIEKILLKEQIPCQMATGKSILDHPAIKKIQAYLRFVQNPKDNISFRQILEIQCPSNSTFKKLEQMAYQQNTSYKIATVKAILSPVFTDMEKLAFKNILARVNNVLSKSKQAGISQLVNEILDDSDRNGIFWLDKYYDQLSDPIGENKQNEALLYLLKEAVGKNAIIVIDSGTSASDHLWTDLLKRYIAGIATMPIDRFKAKPGAFDDKHYLLISKDAKNKPALGAEKKWQKQMIIGKGTQTADFSSDLQTFSIRFFKLIQAFVNIDASVFPDTYVILDLETTSKDTETCEIVEIAAIRIKDNTIIDTFSELIKPSGAISDAAKAVHNITAEALQDKPSINDKWPEFLQFIGDSMLVAHNGVNFDFQILNRVNRQINQKKLENIVFDSLTFARQILRTGNHSIDALMEKFSIEADKRHRALDDVKALHQILCKLENLYLAKNRVTALEQELPLLSLVMYYESGIMNKEEELLFQLGAEDLTKSIPRIIRDDYAGNPEKLETLLKNVAKNAGALSNIPTGQQNIREKLQHLFFILYEFEKDYPDQGEAIANFIQFLSLYTDSPEPHDKRDVVTLTTLHASKGLEFDKVIIAGLHDNFLPSYWSYQTDDLDDLPISRKLEEQRRLFYVGMTRAKNELILTSSATIDHKKQEKPSPFIAELGLKKNI